MTRDYLLAMWLVMPCRKDDNLAMTERSHLCECCAHYLVRGTLDNPVKAYQLPITGSTFCQHQFSYNTQRTSDPIEPMQNRSVRHNLTVNLDPAVSRYSQHLGRCHVRPNQATPAPHTPYRAGCLPASQQTTPTLLTTWWFALFLTPNTYPR